MMTLDIPEEVPESSLDQVPGHKDVDVLVGNVLEGDGPGVGVDEADHADNEAVEG